MGYYKLIFDVAVCFGFPPESMFNGLPSATVTGCSPRRYVALRDDNVSCRLYEWHAVLAGANGKFPAAVADRVDCVQ